MGCGNLASMQVAAMRVARPTRDLSRIRRFYEVAVGLAVIWTFNDHDGFDGVIFGSPEARWQLEIVSTPHEIKPRPTIEDALVLYLADVSEISLVTQRLRAEETAEVSANDPELNPYWPRNGALTFVDPDGYRLIISPE